MKNTTVTKLGIRTILEKNICLWLFNIFDIRIIFKVQNIQLLDDVR
jgi:hypothetical protein